MKRQFSLRIKDQCKVRRLSNPNNRAEACVACRKVNDKTDQLEEAIKMVQGMMNFLTMKKIL